MRATPNHCPREIDARRRHRLGHAVTFAVALTMGVTALSIGLYWQQASLRPAAGVAGFDRSAPLLRRMPHPVSRSPAAGEPELLAPEIGWSVDPPESELARHFEPQGCTNLRVSVSGELFNRLLSQPRIAAEPLRQRTNTASIVGKRTTNTNLFLRLLPADDQWRLQFVADGTFTGDATVFAGAATFFIEGSGSFQSNKLLVFDRHQIDLAAAEATGDLDFHVSGFRTSMDAVPLIGRMARDSALSRLRQQELATRQQLEAEVQDQARRALDHEIAAFVDSAKAQLEIRALEPLENLGLPLTPIHLRTTQKRLLGDFCLGGSPQAGRDALPPAAPDRSLASMQLHESAINNVFEQLQLGGREGHLRDLCYDLCVAIGLPDADLHDGVPHAIALRFAEQQPLRVEFREGQAQLVARLASFSIAEKHWRDLTVRCAYRLDDSSQMPALKRVGSVTVESRQLGVLDRLILDGVFERMFACVDGVPVLPEELVDDPGLSKTAVIQCHVDDGWLTVSLGPQMQLGFSRESSEDHLRESVAIAQ